MKDYSPFTPGVPVPVEFFVGRTAEVDRLREKLGQARAGRVQVAFLSGERGIGKSSLAGLMKSIAEREYQFIGVHALLGGVSSLTEMVHRVFGRLLKESIDRTWYEQVISFFGEHVKKIGAYGVSLEFAAGEADLQMLVRNFAPTLKRLVQRVSDEKKGLLIILDDINGLATSEEFANWLKSTVDEIALPGESMPVFFLLVGLDERRQSLVKLQPSLARILDPTEITAWSDGETQLFYEAAFATVGMSLAEGATRLMVEHTGGLPVLAHEIGNAVFRVDEDGHVDENEAYRGVVVASMAVAQRYFEPQISQTIWADRYVHVRPAVRALASASAAGRTERFTRNGLRESLPDGDSRALDSFLKRMVDLGVLVRDPARERGTYRFRTRLDAVYFAIASTDRASMEALLEEGRQPLI